MSAAAHSPKKRRAKLGKLKRRAVPHQGVSTIKECAMLSARNQFKGTVKSVKLGTVMAEVVVTVGTLEVVSAITRASAEALKLQAGDPVKAIIKSTEIMIDK
jgi:molybdopterin-binding protein